MAPRDDLRNRTANGSNTTLGVAIGVGAVLVLGLWFFTRAPDDLGTNRTTAPTMSQSEKTNSPGTSKQP
jgi:hypothetical protein